MLKNIVLPTGTLTVKVREIAALFATAIHPEVPDDAPREIIEIKKMPVTEANKRHWCGEGTQAFPVRLTVDDLAMLEQTCWKHLPKLALPIAEEAWKPYVESFTSSNIADWQLIITMQNPAMNRRVLLDMTVDKYAVEVRNAAQRGELEPRDMETLQPVPQASGEQLLNAFVTVENLREYAARFLIGIQEAALVVQDEEASGEHEHAAVPKLITRNKVMGCFPVKANADANVKYWNGVLGRPPKWLIKARKSSGKPGVSALWGAMEVAECLLEAGKMTLPQLNAAMHKFFPELSEQWEKGNQDNW